MPQDKKRQRVPGETGDPQGCDLGRAKHEIERMVKVVRRIARYALAALMLSLLAGTLLSFVANYTAHGGSSLADSLLSGQQRVTSNVTLVFWFILKLWPVFLCFIVLAFILLLLTLLILLEVLHAVILAKLRTAGTHDEINTVMDQWYELGLPLYKHIAAFDISTVTTPKYITALLGFIVTLLGVDRYMNRRL